MIAKPVALVVVAWFIGVLWGLAIGLAIGERLVHYPSVSVATCGNPSAASGSVTLDTTGTVCTVVPGTAPNAPTTNTSATGAARK